MVLSVVSVSVPEMVRPRTVSQWGPNAQGVRSRPDRSVSLRDVRDLPVQTMGFDFDEFDSHILYSSNCINMAYFSNCDWK